MHGKTSKIFHDEKGLFSGAENPFVATRYHSLVIERESIGGQADRPDQLLVAGQHAQGDPFRFKPRLHLSREAQNPLGARGALIVARPVRRGDDRPDLALLATAGPAMAHHVTVRPLTTACPANQVGANPFTDVAAFFRPVCTASSRLFLDEALSSMTFATDMAISRW